ncbi:hypothetical protein D9756_008358 [Leucocoprinus leucothites]|uniref:Uncharacterized protein n=1 Tax=Leucocoprinus leucothites TaxID=201217 RepID=A0A8H5CZN7_9AGAR|nr:hypothetical protein D9756_008358 [Leucoagaricus leucothites]
MPLKRPHDSTPLDARDKKRLHSVSLPVTPAASHISFSTPLKTPHTPYPPHPFDSPGNPFGRKRIKHLTRALPESTSFSKHLPLRFQFIRTGSASTRQGGVYRVVQVPLSYTFIHLRCLIAWLFSGLPGHGGVDEHLFEVKKDVSIYSHLYKPGQVKSGQTWVKLSSSQDPYRYRQGYFNDDEEEREEDQLASDAEEGFGEEEDGLEDCEDEEQEDWKWEDEDDFTLVHAWPKGPELGRAIIYHHSLTTQIHITVNQTSIPRRRGRSNTPYVFSARGRIWLSAPPLPRPVFAVPAKKVESPGHKRKSSPKVIEDNDADGDTEEASETESDTEDDKDDEQGEDVNLELDAEHWNRSSNAFAKFLARYMGSLLPESTPSSSRVASSFDHEEEYLSEGDTLQYPSTPGLTRSSSVPSSPGPTLATSSPPRASSSVPVRVVSPSTSDAEDSEGGYITLSLPALTPFPVKARPIRKRMERIEKRMGKMKKGKWLCQHDDKDDEEEEKDELGEDDQNENVAPVPTKVTGKGVRTEESEPLDWDPFGDEEEL